VFDLVKGDDEDMNVTLKKFVEMLSYGLNEQDPFWLAEFIDFRLGGELNYLQAEAMIKVAVSCMEEERKKRPTMESVVESLLHVAEINETS
jgi:hypothetical protein